MSDDLISRQAAIDFIDAGHFCNPNEPRWSDNDIVNFLKSRPSAPQWVPCSERLPEGDGGELKLVTYIDPREGSCVWLGWYEMEGVWYIDGDAHSKELGNEVTAWMNIPGAYEEAEE